MNKELSAVTNQVLELIIDNVRLVHINHKLVEYFKEQSIKLEASTGITKEQLSEALKDYPNGMELSSIIVDLESEKKKKKELIKEIEHERYQRVLDINNHSSLKKSSDFEIKELK